MSPDFSETLNRRASRFDSPSALHTPISVPMIAHPEMTSQVLGAVFQADNRWPTHTRVFQVTGGPAIGKTKYVQELHHQLNRNSIPWGHVNFEESKEEKPDHFDHPHVILDTIIASLRRKNGRIDFSTWDRTLEEYRQYMQKIRRPRHREIVSTIRSYKEKATIEKRGFKHVYTMNSNSPMPSEPEYAEGDMDEWYNQFERMREVFIESICEAGMRIGGAIVLTFDETDNLSDVARYFIDETLNRLIENSPHVIVVWSSREPNRIIAPGSAYRQTEQVVTNFTREQIEIYLISCELGISNRDSTKLYDLIEEMTGGHPAALALLASKLKHEGQIKNKLTKEGPKLARYIYETLLLGYSWEGLSHDAMFALQIACLFDHFNDELMRHVYEKLADGFSYAKEKALFTSQPIIYLWQTGKIVNTGGENYALNSQERQLVRNYLTTNNPELVHRVRELTLEYYGLPKANEEQKPTNV